MHKHLCQFHVRSFWQCLSHDPSILAICCRRVAAVDVALHGMSIALMDVLDSRFMRCFLIFYSAKCIFKDCHLLISAVFDKYLYF
jgi:hypothetical protein